MVKRYTQLGWAINEVLTYRDCGEDSKEVVMQIAIDFEVSLGDILRHLSGESVEGIYEERSPSVSKPPVYASTEPLVSLEVGCTYLSKCGRSHKITTHNHGYFSNGIMHTDHYPDNSGWTHSTGISIHRKTWDIAGKCTSSGYGGLTDSLEENDLIKFLG